MPRVTVSLWKTGAVDTLMVAGAKPEEAQS